MGSQRILATTSLLVCSGDGVRIATYFGQPVISPTVLQHRSMTRKNFHCPCRFRGISSAEPPRKH